LLALLHIRLSAGVFPTPLSLNCRHVVLDVPLSRNFPRTA
jgi:hypothetical protein